MKAVPETQKTQMLYVSRSKIIWNISWEFMAHDACHDLGSSTEGMLPHKKSMHSSLVKSLPAFELSQRHLHQPRWPGRVSVEYAPISPPEQCEMEQFSCWKTSFGLFKTTEKSCSNLIPTI